MRKLFGLLTLLALSGTILSVLPESLASAAEPADRSPNLEHEVRRLLEDLAAETRARRLAAEQQLVELGPKILPLLPAPEVLLSASVREAVRRTRFELERIQARESVLPSHVTLDGRQPVGKALTEITRQTGNRLDGSRLPKEILEQPIGINFDSTAFWKVLDDLAARLDVQYEFDASVSGLELSLAATDRRPRETARCYPGAFRIEAPPAERITRPFIRRPAIGQKNQKPDARDDLLRVTLLLFPEPRLRPLFLQFTPSGIGVCTEDKTSLNPLSPEANFELALGEGTGPSRLQVDYLIPRADRSAELNLKGRVRCTAAAGNENIRFTNLAKAAQEQGVSVARRRGGVTVTLNRVEVAPPIPGKKEVRVRIAVTYDIGGPAFESHQRWILHNKVYLEDAAGKQLRLNGGSETSLQAEGGMEIEYRFVDVPDPVPEYTFVYVAPTLIIDVPIEFEIQSVAIQNKQK